MIKKDLNSKGKIKAIAFDLVGVLVQEKDVKLSPTEDVLERKFGKLNDEEYYSWAKKETGLTRKQLEKITSRVIGKIYQFKEPNLFLKIPRIKFALATNHISIANKWFKKISIAKYFYCLVNSSIVKTEKPNKSFFNILSAKLKEKPENILFIDDSEENINAAKKLGFQILLFKKPMKLSKEINRLIKD